MRPKYTILMLAEDSPFYLNLERILEHKGCMVLRDATQVEAVPSGQLALILAQIHREDKGELAVLKQLKRLHPQVRMILCSGDGEKTFPLEAYQLEVEAYLFMPCSLAELWRRVAACLQKPLKKPDHPARAGLDVPVNRTLMEASRRMLEYFRYNLGASTLTLKTLVSAPASRPEERFAAKIHEVSARLEVLQEMTDAFLRGISGMEAVTWAIPQRSYERLSLNG